MAEMQVLFWSLHPHEDWKPLFPLLWTEFTETYVISLKQFQACQVSNLDLIHHPFLYPIYPRYQVFIYDDNKSVWLRIPSRLVGLSGKVCAKLRLQWLVAMVMGGEYRGQNGLLSKPCVTPMFKKKKHQLVEKWFDRTEKSWLHLVIWDSPCGFHLLFFQLWRSTWMSPG